jgi:hypothetical protein
MTVNSVSSVLKSYQPELHSPWKQRAQDFKALESALQAGDLTSAQTAFAALQKDQPAYSQVAQANRASGKNTQGAKDFEALQSALGSGDLSAAQQAFATLKEDMQGAGQPGRHRHRHVGSVNDTTSAADASSTTSTSQGAKDLEALQNALGSGDLTAAQQAFAALKQDLQATGASGRHRRRQVGSINSTTTAANATAGTTGTQSAGSVLDVQV